MVLQIAPTFSISVSNKVMKSFLKRPFVLLQMTVDTYLGSVMSNALCAVMFGIFKCTNFAEVLYSISQLDSQLELKEKHYDKVRSGSGLGGDIK